MLAWPTDTWRRALLVKPEPHFVHSKPRPFNYTNPIPLKRIFDLLSVKASVQLMRFFLFGSVTDRRIDQDLYKEQHQSVRRPVC